MIKYYFCALCSIAYKSNELPKKPKGRIENNRILPVYGKLYKAILTRLRTGNKKAVTFASTIFLSRYSAIKVPETFVEQSEKSYIERLSKIPVQKQYDESSLRSAVSQFGKSSFEKLCSAGVKFLSISAVAEKNIHGQYGVIEEFAPKVTWEKYGQRYEGICPVPYFANSFMPAPDELCGNVTHLTEPLKVRSITTESAFEFLAGKPIQDCVSKEMKKMKNLCFGRTVECEDIQLLVHRSRLYYGEQEEMVFLSGDYEAATDNLSPLLSQKVDNMMLDHMGLNFHVPQEKEFSLTLWRIMARIYQFMIEDDNGPNTTKVYWIKLNTWMRSRLSEHNCQKVLISDKRNGTWSGRKIGRLVTQKGSFVQTFGQMMGDIKSFPVLCCINLALWNLVNDNQVRSRMLSSQCPLTDIKSFSKVSLAAPCLINGDDFLAYCPRSIAEKWFANVKEFDLVASLGKTYTSPTVAQINSTNFMLNGDGVVLKINALPLHAVLSIPRDRPVEQSINYAIEHRSELLNRLIFFNKERIRQVTGNGLINLCLPVHLGGLGVKATPHHITTRQLLLADKNSKSFKPLRVIYQWLPFGFYKGKDKKNRVIVHKSLPKGFGKVVDEFGFEHIMSTYKSTEESRLLFGDNWLACMSRQKFNANNGRMVIKGNFFKKFAKISNDLVNNLKRSSDKRLPDIQKILSRERRDEVLVKGRYRPLIGGKVSFGVDCVARVDKWDEESQFYITEQQEEFEETEWDL
jgi:hypothetical protein